MSPMRRAGFTLIEVLAVVLLTSVVIGVALDHYVNLSRATQHATASTREVRRAAAILDRVARDLESVVLVAKEPETDPLEHPWIFLGESQHSEAGADHLKFVTRGRRPRASQRHESDLEQVVYALRRARENSFELMRWSSPQLSDGLDRSLPDDESDGAVLLAEDIASFGVNFIDALGERTSSWDSSQLIESSELPVAVEIEIALLDPGAMSEREPVRYRRRVVLPVAPLDLQELLDPLALVSGGPGTPEEQELAAQDNEGLDDSSGSAECLASPCAGMTACQAINCAAKLGRYGHSMDVMLDVTMRNNQTFCQWRRSYPHRMRWIVDNPACR
jgi:prepilin-type N-terminal cleavage/methylation domain-containing protein